MDLPSWLIGLFDPASREFERNRRRRHGRRHPRRTHAFRGGVVMGPNIPGGSRQATPEELATSSAMAGRLHARYETVLAQVFAAHGDQLRTAAQDLLANGRTRVTLAAVTLDAELLSFWRGDRLLRIESATRDRASAGSSLTRFPRHDPPDSGEIIAHYLASNLANDRING